MYAAHLLLSIFFNLQFPPEFFADNHILSDLIPSIILTQTKKIINSNKKINEIFYLKLTEMSIKTITLLYYESICGIIMAKDFTILYNRR